MQRAGGEHEDVLGLGHGQRRGGQRSRARPEEEVSREVGSQQSRRRRRVVLPRVVLHHRELQQEGLVVLVVLVLVADEQPTALLVQPLREELPAVVQLLRLGEAGLVAGGEGGGGAHAQQGVRAGDGGGGMGVRGGGQRGAQGAHQLHACGAVEGGGGAVQREQQQQQEEEEEEKKKEGGEGERAKRAGEAAARVEARRRSRREAGLAAARNVLAEAVVRTHVITSQEEDMAVLERGIRDAASPRAVAHIPGAVPLEEDEAEHVLAQQKVLLFGMHEVELDAASAEWRMYQARGKSYRPHAVAVPQSPAAVTAAVTPVRPRVVDQSPSQEEEGDGIVLPAVAGAVDPHLEPARRVLVMDDEEELAAAAGRAAPPPEDEDELVAAAGRAQARDGEEELVAAAPPPRIRMQTPPAAVPKPVADTQAPVREAARELTAVEQMAANNASVKEKLAAVLYAQQDFVHFVIVVQLRHRGRVVPAASRIWASTSVADAARRMPKDALQGQVAHEALEVMLEPNDEPELLDVRDDGNYGDLSWSVAAGAWDEAHIAVWSVDKSAAACIATFPRSRKQLVEMQHEADVDGWGTGCRIDVPAGSADGEPRWADDDDGVGWVSFFFRAANKRTGTTEDLFDDVRFAADYADIAPGCETYEDLDGWARLVRPTQPTL